MLDLINAKRDLEWLESCASTHEPKNTNTSIGFMVTYQSYARTRLIRNSPGINMNELKSGVPIPTRAYLLVSRARPVARVSADEVLVSGDV